MPTNFSHSKPYLEMIFGLYCMKTLLTFMASVSDSIGRSTRPFVNNAYPISNPKMAQKKINPFNTKADTPRGPTQKKVNSLVSEQQGK